MKKNQQDAVTNYFERFQFPGGITLYPLGYLKALPALRTTSSKHGGTIQSKQFGPIPFESRREKQEIYRIMKILAANDVRTQVLELVTPSGKSFYPDIMAQLGDGSIVIVEVKHILDFLWDEVIEKYHTLLAYCADRGYGMAMLDGRWRDFTYVLEGGTIHFHAVIEWFETVIGKKGTFTMKDLRQKFKEEKYWPTLVSYCLMNQYHSHHSFRDPRWEIAVTRSS